MSGNWYVGGICGYNSKGTLQGCRNNGTVSGDVDVGGVCGYNISGTLENSYNTGDVSGRESVGGVCGFNSGTLQESYNTGDVSGTGSGVGGVCGRNDNGGGTLKKSYNTGDVSGGSKVGGVCGDNYGTVNGCYTTGKVTGTKWVGGVCGYNYQATLNNCYYLAGTSEKAVDYKIDGVYENCESKTEAEFRSGAVAYRLQAALGGGADQVWGQNIGTDKAPVLSNNPDYAVHPAAEGSTCKRYSNKSNQKFDKHEYDEENGVCIRCGEWQEATLAATGDYYEIRNQGQLRWFAKLVNGTLMQDMPAKPAANAVLMQAIDITVDTVDTVGKRWPGIGTSDNPYNGRFNGNGHTVSLTDPAATTLFDTTSTEAKLDTICVTGGYLTQTDSAVVTNCYRPEDKPLFQNKAAGSATNCYALGKLVEQESSGAAFTNCYEGADSGNSINIMNADAFTNGEVAYKLAMGDPEWGQTLTEPNKQAFPVPGGETVYRSTPCPTDYSNGGSKNKDHNIGTNGKCTACDELCIAYTVTIPATVELGNTASTKADITAKDVTLPANQTLKVTINGINGTNGIDSTNDINGTNGINGSNGVFTATLDSTSETVSYTIKNGTTELTPGETVLTAASGEAGKTTALTFVKPDNAPYAGSYTGTVTFTVSVVDETTH